MNKIQALLAVLIMSCFTLSAYAGQANFPVMDKALTDIKQDVNQNIRPDIKEAQKLLNRFKAEIDELRRENNRLNGELHQLKQQYSTQVQERAKPVRRQRLKNFNQKVRTQGNRIKNRWQRHREKQRANFEAEMERRSKLTPWERELEDMENRN